MNFTYFYKKKFESIAQLNTLDEYDFLLSGYNTSERVIKVFDKIPAKQKIWITFPECLVQPFNQAEGVRVYHCKEKNNESIDSLALIDSLKLNAESKICIDISGLIVPFMLFTIKYLYNKGIKKIDVVYSEPQYYKYKENTPFSEDFHKVRQIYLYEGTHSSVTSNDILIIASGYDSSRITDVANNKAKARKVQLFGFPSLQADMYQENILNAYKAESAVGGESFIDDTTNLFAPANDPFVAAQVIKKFVERENARKKITNLYLSPLSTKPHALGMALYYIWDWDTKNASIIYPFCEKHLWDTATGISGVMKYTLEFPPTT